MCVHIIESTQSSRQRHSFIAFLIQLKSNCSYLTPGTASGDELVNKDTSQTLIISHIFEASK